LIRQREKKILPAMDAVLGPEIDARVRAAAFAYLDTLTGQAGGLVTRAELESFEFEGQRIRLIAVQQGIWRPRFLSAALSIVTTFVPPGQVPPYQDQMGADGYPRYKWRGTDPMHADNVGLRRAMMEARPLMWFIGVRPGVYEPSYPVVLVGEEPLDHQFVLALDETMRQAWRPGLETADPYDPARRYAEVLVKQRLHQRVFRDRVLIAYESRCALCRLGHRELLDAAHIREDAQGGMPVVPNGLSMCAIHHRAFDSFVLTVRPDYTIEIRPDVLDEADGPTLRHAFQGLHRAPIHIPRRRSEQPDRELLEERYARFRTAS
jgi:putative restriction endonuclease